MNRRTLKHGREELVRQARAVIVANPDSRFAYMATIVLFYLSGRLSLSELSEVGITEKMANALLRKAGREGIEALRTELRAVNPYDGTVARALRHPNEHKFRKSSLGCEKRAK